MAKLSKSGGGNFAIVGMIVAAILALYIGNEIIESVVGTANVTTGDTFYNAFSFMGIADGATTSTGIIGVMGLVVVAVIVLGFVRKNL